MLNRKFFLALLVYTVALTAAFGQSGGTASPGTGLLFQLPGIGSTSGQFIGYAENANPLNPSITATGPAGTAHLIFTPDGTKVFLIGSSVQSIDGSFSTAPQTVNGLAGAPTAAAISPDGTILAVGASDSNNNGLLYFVNTSSNQVISAGIPLPSQPNFAPGTTGFCPACWIAFTPDSKTVYVLTNSGVGSRLTAFNTTTHQQTGQLTLTGGATSVGVSPLGLVYVTAVNVIDEIDPSTFQLTPNGTISLFFSPGRLRFAYDGTTAYAPNLVPTSGGSLMQLNLANHSVNTWPPNTPGTTPPLFDDILIAGNGRIFATSSQNQTLFDVATNPLSASASTATVGPTGLELQTQAAAVSGEIPTSSNLFVLAANGNQTLLYRINLATNTVAAQSLATSISTNMQFVDVDNTSVSSPANFLQLNNNQVLQTGGTTAPLIVRVLDANGFPVFNVPVSFTVDPASNVTLSGATAVTNAGGYAQVTAKIPNVGGIYTINVTSGAANTSFTVTVPGGVTGGGGSTSSQVQVFAGNGQIFQEDFNTNFPSYTPLTVQVTDTNGKPMAGVAVTWAIAPGNPGDTDPNDLSYSTPLPGALFNSDSQTDSNGIATTGFFASTIPINLSFISGSVTATTALGTATFSEVIVHLNGSSGQPQFDLITPQLSSNYTINAGLGTPMPNAIQVRITSANFPEIGKAIGGVTLAIQNGLDSTLPAQAQCQGSTTSDEGTGVASCTLVVSCVTGQGSFPINVVAGGFRQFPIQLIVGPGGPSQLTIVGGNNQSGTAGQTLAQPLTAVLTDGCGNAVAGGTVTWKVTQGAATLTNTVNTSDGQGRVSTKLILGQSAGAITVTATTATGVVAKFTVTNQVIVSSLTVLSGGAQTGNINQAFVSPIVVAVKDNNGNPVPGITVTFAVASGSGVVNPPSVTTGSGGTAQATITAGPTAGPIVVTASASNLTTQATVTSILPGPSITASSFVNAASFQPGLAVCGLASVRGAGLAPSVNGVVSGLSPFGPLPFTIAGVSITVNLVQAPIESVSNENGVQQVTFQVPCELSAGPATVVVSVNGSVTTVSNVAVLAAQPGIFTYQGANGTVYGAVISAANGSYVTPTNFAVRGQTYYLVVTGLGQTSPATSTDSAGFPNQTVASQVVVGVDNAGVPVISTQYQQGQIGVYLIAFQIPLNAPTGPNQPLAVAVIVNGQPVYGNSVFLPGVQ